MNKLEEARIQIDKIDETMAALFKQRMLAVEQVLIYKKANNLPVLDSTRENAMIQKNINRFESNKYSTYYELFLKSILEISRKYQEDHYE
jgi:monofunctional chorismate mutase